MTNRLALLAPVVALAVTACRGRRRRPMHPLCRFGVDRSTSRLRRHHRCRADHGRTRDDVRFGDDRRCGERGCADIAVAHDDGSRRLEHDRGRRVHLRDEPATFAHDDGSRPPNTTAVPRPGAVDATPGDGCRAGHHQRRAGHHRRAGHDRRGNGDSGTGRARDDRRRRRLRRRCRPGADAAALAWTTAFDSALPFEQKAVVIEDAEALRPHECRPTWS